MSSPDLQLEFALRNRGFQRIAGIDEAGRGAWAGPVVAGAVILPLDQFDLAHQLEHVNDSKLLSAPQREACVPQILSTALAANVGFATHEEIDTFGIVPATRLAMQRAIAGLSVTPDALLVDALDLPALPMPCIALIHGDRRSLSIAAASVLAKVARDQHMDELDLTFPQYGFRVHKGYGTALHRQQLRIFGPSPLHRLTFAPLAALFRAGVEGSTT